MFSVPYDPNGVAHDRLPRGTDMLYDTMDPREKSLYPKFFAEREKMKDEFIELWKKDFGKPPLELKRNLNDVYEPKKK